MKTITISGKEYKLPTPDQKLYNDIISWARQQKPTETVDAIATVKQLLKELDLPATSPVAEKLILDAYHTKLNQKKISPAEELQDVIATPEGSKELVRLLFQRHQPELSAEDCFNLHLAATLEHGDDYLFSLGIFLKPKK
jgi:hypothetical protein